MTMRRYVPVLVALAIVALPALAHADTGAFEKYQERGWAWMFLASFGFGFLTSLIPCVYPMIPITLAIFGAHGPATRPCRGAVRSCSRRSTSSAWG